MKSAKRMKSTKTTVLIILVILSFTISLVGCDRQSFFAPLWQEDTPDPPSEPSEDAMTDGTDPTPDPPAPIFYNQLTGLVCDEALSSYRPISVCIGNFDGTRQEGLSLADVLIEAPIDGGATRLWAMLGTPSAAAKLSSVRSVRDYMMPLARSFGSITAYAGTTDTPGASNTPFSGDTLDYIHHNLSSTFTKEGDTLSVDGNALLSAAGNMGYTTKAKATLPYALTAPNETRHPTGNRISSIHFSFSEGNTVDFSYREDTGLYARSQNGEAHTDAANGEQLAFQNVILLFHNVNYYHSADGTSFSLDTAAGGDGFCYTGGGVVGVKWRADANGEIAFFDTSGNPLTVNRGKTYIGMLRITDSTSVIAK